MLDGTEKRIYRTRIDEKQRDVELSITRTREVGRSTIRRKAMRRSRVSKNIGFIIAGRDRSRTLTR